MNDDVHPHRQFLLVILFLIVAAILQGRLAHALHFRIGQPDLILVVLACGATLLGPARGPLVGLAGGLLTAALVPLTQGSYLVSRVIAGTVAGYLQRRVIRDSIAAPPITVVVTTLVAAIAYALAAPPHHIKHWLAQVAGQTIYNMLLSMPVYFLMRKCDIGEAEEDPFSTKA